MTALLLSNDRMSEMKNSSLLGPPQKTSMVSAAPGGHFGIHGPLPQTMIKWEVQVDVPPTAAESLADVPGLLLLMSLVWATTEAILMSTDHASPWGHVVVSGLGSHLRPR